MGRRKWTDEQKAEAVELYMSVGPSEAHRRTKIPKGTIASWANRQGLQTEGNIKTAKAVERAAIDIKVRKQQLAESLLDDAEKLRGQLFGKATLHHFNKDGDFSEADIDEPTFVDKKNIMTAIAIAVDKIQLLTGEATSRNENVELKPKTDQELSQLRDELAERRKEKTG